MRPLCGQAASHGEPDAALGPGAGDERDRLLPAGHPADSSVAVVSLRVPDAQELADHLDRLDRNGYTVVEDAFSADLADELRADIERLEVERDIRPGTNGFEGRATMRVYNLLALGEPTGEIVDPRLQLVSLLGPSVKTGPTLGPTTGFRSRCSIAFSTGRGTIPSPRMRLG